MEEASREERLFTMLMRGAPPEDVMSFLPTERELCAIMSFLAVNGIRDYLAQLMSMLPREHVWVLSAAHGKTMEGEDMSPSETETFLASLSMADAFRLGVNEDDRQSSKSRGAI